MKPNDAVALLQIMKRSYTEQTEKEDATADRKHQCFRRVQALDVAIVAITEMEAANAAKANAG